MTEPPKLYGVWIPGEGWLKTHSGAVAFVHEIVADSTAKRIGRGAYVDFIDDSLKDLEMQLLQAEQEQADQKKEKVSLWNRLLAFVNSKKRIPN